MNNEEAMKALSKLDKSLQAQLYIAKLKASPSQRKSLFDNPDKEDTTIMDDTKCMECQCANCANSHSEECGNCKPCNEMPGSRQVWDYSCEKYIPCS